MPTPLLASAIRRSRNIGRNFRPGPRVDGPNSPFPFSTERTRAIPRSSLPLRECLRPMTLA
eukprot:5536607-Pyramimonas_sp.AAC.1